ncbi:MAG TPA: DUF4234 domain-containing protein [Nocardioides sp.]|jgi:hypothetical protein|uniref:DUF4234 domain-containing protein n=1 Tax=Nocardioides sp. TaxID=35761 RepID=UPI002E382408|nr:DUF4234 domain-containing protein [Nocardioides sp.]HEX3932644.1 DUF4234 domain-containing protein [Nocardioides sp.]
MTDQPTSPYPQSEPPPPDPAQAAPAYSDAPAGQSWAPPPPATQQYAGVPAQSGPVGKVRGTGLCILLFIVTLGIYGLFWYYNTHEEMKRSCGEGIGGVLALILGFFISIVMVFLTPHEVGRLYERRQQKPPVSALTGLWILLPLAGGIVWFVKTNGALNAYWKSLGAA